MKSDFVFDLKGKRERERNSNVNWKHVSLSTIHIKAITKFSKSVCERNLQL